MTSSQRAINFYGDRFRELLLSECAGYALFNPRSGDGRRGSIGDVGYFRDGGWVKVRIIDWPVMKR